MITFLSDVRHAARTLLRAPTFSLASVLVLALGIGATTAVFSLVYAFLFAPLPYANADRLVMVWEAKRSRNDLRNVINAGNYLAWSARSTAFEDTAIFTTTRSNLTGGGEPEELPGMAVEANLLRLVGARPLLGRVFADGEDQEDAPRVVLISEGLWRRRFGQRADILGQVIRLNDEPATIVGVLPAGYELFGFQRDFYAPLVLSPFNREFRGRGFMSVGLLAPGVSRDQAQAELEQVFAGLVEEHPEFNAGWSINLVPLREQLTGDLRPALLSLFGAVFAVLLIACVNLANLLLARAAGRHHELALRTALGAGSGRLARLLFTETALLVVAGGTLGVALGWWLQALVVGIATDVSVPLLGQVGMGWPVIAFAVSITGGTALACGLAPAFATRRLNLVEPLREGGRGAIGSRHGRLRAALVIAEVAIAVVLLGGAGLLVRSFAALQAVPPGFNPEQVLTMKVLLSAQSIEDAPRVARFHEQAVERLRAVPGVRQAAGTVFLPLAGLGSATSFWLLDRPEPPAADKPVADIRPVTDAYFSTLGIPLIAGRDFTPGDTADRPLVGIVNEAFAQRFFPDRDPVGQRLTYAWDKPTTVEIVGVVGDVKLTSLDGETRTTLYLPNQQRPLPLMTYALRTDGAPSGVATAAVAALRSLAPDQPVTDVRTLDAVVEQSLRQPRITSTALAAFAAVALLLAVVGVYGVVAYGVTARLGEFGVRLALGAEPRDVMWLVLRQGLLLVGAGVIFGLGLTIPVSRALRSLLFGVGPGDPVALSVAAAAILVAALVACYVPARRGTLVDPATTLRAE
ncbi:MAG: ABC transporter permease [Vicinamibacterales bacterium]